MHVEVCMHQLMNVDYRCQVFVILLMHEGSPHKINGRLSIHACVFAEQFHFKSIFTQPVFPTVGNNIFKTKYFSLDFTKFLLPDTGFFSFFQLIFQSLQFFYKLIQGHCDFTNLLVLQNDIDHIVNLAGYE